MKKYIGCLLLLGFIIGFPSCKMELEPYNEQENWISFVFEKGVDSVMRYTFAYYPEEVKTDTIFIEVTAVGYLSEQERKFTVIQNIAEGVDNAEEGIHFVPFADLAGYYAIAANTTGVKVPVVVKRDPSLKEKEYVLEIKLTENSDFQLASPNSIVKRIVLSDILTKPNTWKGAAAYYLGTYGTEKHKVMIAATAHYGITVNDEWIDAVFNKGDYGYVNYWRGIFNTKLQEINDQRAQEGQGPLTEGPEYGQITVSF